MLTWSAGVKALGFMASNTRFKAFPLAVSSFTGFATFFKSRAAGCSSLLPSAQKGGSCATVQVRAAGPFKYSTIIIGKHLYLHAQGMIPALTRKGLRIWLNRTAYAFVRPKIELDLTCTHPHILICQYSVPVRVSCAKIKRQRGWYMYLLVAVLNSELVLSHSTRKLIMIFVWNRQESVCTPTIRFTDALKYISPKMPIEEIMVDAQGFDYGVISTITSDDIARHRIKRILIECQDLPPGHKEMMYKGQPSCGVAAACAAKLWCVHCQTNS